MIDNKKIVCVIPARLQSSRLPRKVLLTLLGKPLLQWLWESAHKNAFFDEIVFAIDAQETAELINTFGGRYIMTSQDCATGTDRLLEVAQSGILSSDIWINWQGDDPFISPEMIQDLLQDCGNSTADIWTLKARIEKEEDALLPNVSKVVTDESGRALYFSRSPIPFYRDTTVGIKKYYKHIGIYAFTNELVLRTEKNKQGKLEVIEQLEMLRFLEQGMSIKVHETFEQHGGEINVPEDVAIVERFARERLLVNF